MRYIVVSLSLLLFACTPTPSPTPVAPSRVPNPVLSDKPTTCPLGCVVAPNCPVQIKGNISKGSGEKIYHVPGQKYYPQTIITPSDGERWFCTDREALANGWRKSKE